MLAKQINFKKNLATQPAKNIKISQTWGAFQTNYEFRGGMKVFLKMPSSGIICRKSGTKSYY